MPLDPKQRQFVRSYVTTGNATEAYRKAYATKGPSAKVSACRLLKKPHVKQAVKQYQHWQENPGHIDRTYVIEQLKYLISRCLEDQASVQTIKGALKALELLNQCLQKDDNQNRAADFIASYLS